MGFARAFPTSPSSFLGLAGASCVVTTMSIRIECVVLYVRSLVHDTLYVGA